VLELLDPENEVLVVFPRRKPAPPQSLLHRGVHQRPGACGALAGAVHYIVDDCASLFALDAALLDQGIHDLLHPIPRRRGCPYLQQDQTLKRLANRPAHRDLRKLGFTLLMIAQACEKETPVHAGIGFRCPLLLSGRGAGAQARWAAPRVALARQALYRERTGEAIKMEL
jgi:hypothetical protein